MLEAIMILDKSGSMQGIWPDAVGSVLSVVKDLQALGEDVRFTLTVFDTSYTIIYNGKAAKELTEDQIRQDLPFPGGMTALHDALGRTIDEVGQRLAATPQDKMPSKVRVVIMTDGAENSSQEYSLERVKEMVEHQTTKYGWEFLFTGAGLGDVQTNGAAMLLGISHSLSVDHDSKGMESYTRGSSCFYSGK